MNVASLPLCKELYELSAWKGEDDYIGWVKGFKGQPYIHEPHTDDMGYKQSDWLAPAYDLGYLMRKLPASILEADSEQYIWMFIEKDDDGYGGGYQDINGQTHKLYYAADTPEDAACLLAIELFKQGVLTK